MSEVCFHCGDEAGKNPILYDDKSFCCNGCKSVYQMLSSNGLSSYYKLNQNPGLRPKELDSKYSFLDNEDLNQSLLMFKEDSIVGMRAFLPNIHCSSCIWLLENLHKLQPGIKSSQVNFAKRDFHIVFDTNQISIRRMAEFLDELGYPPVFGNQDQKQEKIINKRFILQLGVAFFCFGNIMLFSFPEYLTVDHTYQEYRKFFSVLIFLFALPILIFSARDFWLSAFKALRSKVLNLDVPITLGILVLFVKSSWDIFQGAGPGYMDSFAGFILFLLLGRWFQYRTHDALNFERDYKSYFPLAIKRIRDGQDEIVRIENVEVEDEIQIHNGEVLPVDAELLSWKTKIDYSFVTGESDLIEKKQGDLIYAGGKVSGSAVRFKVHAEVNRSYLTKLWNNEIFDKTKSSFSKIQESLSRYFLIGLLIVTALIATFWIIVDPSMTVSVVTAVLIVACPCALSISYPFTYGLILRAIGRNGLYLKSTRVVEDLHGITDIAFDKTGTLTTGGAHTVNYIGEPIQDEVLAALTFGTGSSTHPMSVAIHDYLLFNHEINGINEAEFLEEEGLGIQVRVAGNTLKLGSYRYLGLEKIDNETSSFLSWNNRVLGRFALKQEFRPEVAQLFDALKQQGYHLHIITGDNERAQSELEVFARGKAKVLFNQTPQDKLDYIQKLQNQGARVLMFGDGLNDAGALRRSDVGISVSDNVYQFSPSCDGILQADCFKEMPKILQLASKGKSALWVNFSFSIVYNIIGLSIAATGLLSPLIAAILMPLSSLTVAFLSFFQINRYAKRFGLMRARI